MIYREGGRESGTCCLPDSFRKDEDSVTWVGVGVGARMEDSGGVLFLVITRGSSPLTG